MEYEVKGKGSKMQYKFKVGDSVKQTSDAFAKGVCLSVAEGEELKVKVQATWGRTPAYTLHDLKGASMGLFLESEIEPFETLLKKQQKKSTRQKALCTKTMWGLVLKSAPGLLNPEDDLFETRAQARKEKSACDLTAFKVTKVTLTWEG